MNIKKYNIILNGFCVPYHFFQFVMLCLWRQIHKMYGKNKLTLNVSLNPKLTGFIGSLIQFPIGVK